MTGQNSPEPARESTRRLFFALWPDAALRASLQRRLAPLCAPDWGRVTGPAQWHVTLEFLGSLEAPALWDRLVALGPDGARIIGIGNIAGIGHRLLEHLEQKVVPA